ncbi:MAG: sulfatase-like hydrolase/transferase [Actinomycetota bacterium]
MPAPVRNVLFIMCDQLRHDALSCAGGVLDTPNLDALAARGVRFDRAFVQGSVCGSSRMSTYTGRYVQSHGSRYNSVPLPVGEATIGDHLRPLGVRSALVGKTHMAVDHSGLDRLRLDPADPATAVINECGFEPVVRDDGLMPSSSPRRFDHAYNRFLRDHGFGGDNPWHSVANSVVGPDGRRISGWLLEASPYAAVVPDELSETAYMTDHAIRFIRDAGDDRWCLHLSYIKPHWPYVVSAPYHDLVHPNDLPAPNRSDRELETDHPVVRAFHRCRIGATFARDDVRRAVYPAYLGLVKQLDDHLGRLFAALDDLGRSDDTMVVLTSDHGDYMGDHWMGEKDWLHEEIVRVPLIVVDPRPEARPTRGTTSSTLVEAIDLAPTFVDALGGDAGSNHWLEGRSLEPTLHAHGEGREAAVCQSEFSLLEMVHELPPGPRETRRATMVRTDRYKYILSETGPNLLFDLEDDPDELIDRHDDPALGSVRTELHERMFTWYRERSNEVTRRPGTSGGPPAEGDDAIDGIFIGYWDESDVPGAAAENLEPDRT